MTGSSLLLVGCCCTVLALSLTRPTSTLLGVVSGSVVSAKDTNVDDSDSKSSSILIESFQDPGHIWKPQNDPVMGGRSTGNFTIDPSRGVGVFMGDVVDIPFLHTPGFLQVPTVDVDHSSVSPYFPDVSQCAALALRLRSPSSPDYRGFRVSFGTKHANGGKLFAHGFKADLTHVRPDWTDVILPFAAFTDFWDDATGDPIHTCHENADYCPDLATLRNMRTMAFWAEGVAGRIELEIKEIRAVGCSSSKNVAPAAVLRKVQDIKDPSL